MNVISYFAFTILSILVQFSFIDLIQTNLMIENDDTKDLNITSQRQNLSDIINQYYINNTLGIYYKTTNFKKRNAVTIIPKPANESTTTIEYQFTLEEESIPITTETQMSTEPFGNSTEYDNITEFSIFTKKNDSKQVPTISETVRPDVECPCDLSVTECDINCCCDQDCTVHDLKLFECSKVGTKLEKNIFCPFEEKSLLIDNIDGLFCVAKTNLPNKRVVDSDKYDAYNVDSQIQNSFKWRGTNKIQQKPITFISKVYENGDPIWLLTNGSISYLDLPKPTFSNYCEQRIAVRFLQKFSSKCIVPIQDLEILNILKTIEDSQVVSVTEKFLNASYLNCSSLNCISWTISVCNESICNLYNRSLHQPSCTDFICKGLAHRVTYTFYIQNSSISNAYVNLFTQNYSTKTRFIEQHVEVDFHIARHNTEERAIRLSGNPGYLRGFPIIASYHKENHTLNFFEKKVLSKNTLSAPQNKNGFCDTNELPNKVINFDTNLKIKCRYGISVKLFTNGTLACQNLWDKAISFMSINSSVYLSPLGNPKDLSDKDWIKVNETTTPIMPIFGTINKKESTLYCNNVVNSVSLVFGYGEVSMEPDVKQMKILSASVTVRAENRTFDMDDVSVVASFDTTFVDVSKRPVYEYAGAPHLHIHLPKDFFFPLQNKTCNLTSNIILLIILYLTLT